MIQRDGFEEHRHGAVGDCRGRARAQHRGRVGGVAGTRDHEPGDVAQHADGVVVVKVTTEALLIAEPGDAHDHRIAIPALREERQAGGLATQLVLGVVEVGQVLDLGDREQAGHGRAECDAEDRLFVEQAVEHSRRAGALLQTGVTPYTPPLAPTSSPNTSTSGRAASRSPRVRLIVSASVSGPSDSGSRPPKNATRGRCRPRSRRGRGRRRDSAATTAPSPPQCSSVSAHRSSRWPAHELQHASDSTWAHSSAGARNPALTMRRAVPRIGSRQLVVADRRDRPVAGFDIGAGVAHEAHCA